MRNPETSSEDNLACVSKLQVHMSFDPATLLLEIVPTDSYVYPKYAQSLLTLVISGESVCK